MSKKPVRWENTKRYREMRRGLLDNLESRGLIEPMYRGLVDEYMSCGYSSSSSAPTLKSTA